MCLQGIEQGGGETEVALHELAVVLGTVDASEVEHEVALRAPLVELCGGGVEIVLEDIVDCEVAVAARLAGLYVVELGAKVLADETFGTGN